MNTYSSGSLIFEIQVTGVTNPVTLNILDSAASVQGMQTIINPGTYNISAGGFSSAQFDIQNDFSSTGTITINKVSVNETFNLTSSSLVPYGATGSLGSKFQGTGYINARFNGSKLVGSAINANSTKPVDGGPVVKVTKVNPNKIVLANNQLTTIDRATSGRSPNSRFG